MSGRAIALFVRNDDPGALVYATTALQSFAEHHHRFAASIEVYFAEVDASGTPTGDLEAALRQRARGMRFEPFHVGYPLLRPLDAMARAHAFRGTDVVGDALIAYAIRRTTSRILVLLGAGAVLVRDDAVVRLGDAVTQRGAWLAGVSERGSAAAGLPPLRRLQRGVLVACAPALREHFPLQPFLEPRTVEERLRAFSSPAASEPLRRARRIDLLSVLAQWLATECPDPRLLDLEQLCAKFAAGEDTLATEWVVAGRWLDAAARDVLTCTLARAGIDVARHRVLRGVLGRARNERTP